MAVLAIAAAGAAAGSAAFGAATFLGVSAAGWGWAIGAVVGNALFAPKTNAQGPRLTDYRITTSAYGQSLPILLGGYRAGTILIWAGPVTENANTQKVGKRAYQTNYRYSQSFAVALCAGPIEGVRRIWFDNALVYSAEFTDVLTAIEAGKLDEQMTIHLGEEDQDVDVLIEAVEGVGSTPAYRGVAYIVFDDLDLTQWGNRIPSINVEVVESGTYSKPTIISELGITGSNGARWSGQNTVERVTWRIGNFTAFADLWDAEWVDLDGNISTAFGNPLVYIIRADGSVNNFKDDVNSIGIIISNAITYTCHNDPRIAWQTFVESDGPWGPVGGFMLRAVDWPYAAITAVYIGYEFGVDGTMCRTKDRLYFFGGDPPGTAVPKNYVKCLALTSVQSVYITDPFYRFDLPGAELFSVCIQDDLGLTIGGGGTGWVSVDEVTGDVYARHSGMTSPAILRFDKDLNIKTYYSSVGSPTPWAFMVWDDQLCDVSAYGAVTYTVSQYQLEHDEDWPTASTATEIGTATGDSTSFYPAYPYFAYLGGGVFGSQAEEFSMADKLAPGSTTLADCVSKICAAAGIPAGSIDVTDVDSIVVRGMLIDRRTSARSALEPLLAAYGVDALESDGKIVFRQRGAATVGTIEQSAMGAMPQADDGATPLSTRMRGEFIELPERIDIQYADVGAAYESGNQSAFRGSLSTDQQVSVSLPVAMTASEAAQSCWRMLTEAWAQRTERTFSTDMRYAGIEVSDAVLIDRGDGLLSRERIVARDEDDGIIHWRSVEEDDGAFTQVAAGVSLPDPVAPTVPAEQAVPVAFEVPPLRDADAGSGVVLSVVGGVGDATGWPGAAIFESDTTDSTVSQIGEITSVTTIGAAQTQLQDWTVAKGQFDQSDVDIAILGTAPATITVDEQLQGGGLALIGNELVRYRIATDLGDGNYRLSGLLRGVHGTDYAATGHTAFDRFALLSDLDDVASIPRSLASIDSSFLYRTVTGGRDYAEAPSTALKITGRSAMPLPPVHVTLVRESNGDRTFSWVRRSRAYQAWRDSAELPLVESSESYRYQIIDPDTAAVLRSGTVSEASLTYTAAQIEADWDGYPSTIRIKIYQQSALVGDGEPADVTLAWADNFANTYSNGFTSDANLVGFTEVTTDSYVVNDKLTMRYTSPDVKLRLDSVGSFINGEIEAQVKAVVNLFGGEKIGVVARTTNWWTGGLFGFGWYVYVNHLRQVILAYGTNANTTTLTTVQTATIDSSWADLSEHWVTLKYRFQGSRHTVWIDGVKLIDETNSTYQSTSGTCGFSYSGGVAYGYVEEMTVRY